MKWRFQWLYRAVIVLLVALALWANWAAAQNSGSATNAPSVVAFQGGQTNALTSSLASVEFLQHQSFGIPRWKILAFIIYIVLAVLAAKLADLIIGVWLKRWASKTETKYDDIVLELLRGPLKVVVFVLFLHIGLGVFDWPRGRNFI